MKLAGRIYKWVDLSVLKIAQERIAPGVGLVPPSERSEIAAVPPILRGKPTSKWDKSRAVLRGGTWDPENETCPAFCSGFAGRLHRRRNSVGQPQRIIPKRGFIVFQGGAGIAGIMRSISSATNTKTFRNSSNEPDNSADAPVRNELYFARFLRSQTNVSSFKSSMSMWNLAAGVVPTS